VRELRAVPGRGASVSQARDEGGAGAARAGKVQGSQVRKSALPRLAIPEAARRRPPRLLPQRPPPLRSYFCAPAPGRRSASSRRPVSHHHTRSERALAPPPRRSTRTPCDSGVSPSSSPNYRRRAHLHGRPWPRALQHTSFAPLVGQLDASVAPERLLLRRRPRSTSREIGSCASHNLRGAFVDRQTCASRFSASSPARSTDPSHRQQLDSSFTSLLFRLLPRSRTPISRRSRHRSTRRRSRRPVGAACARRISHRHVERRARRADPLFFRRSTATRRLYGLARRLDRVEPRARARRRLRPR